MCVGRGVSSSLIGRGVCCAAHLPRLRLVHPPQLHLAVVRARDDQRQRGVEARPVDAAVVALEHVLHRRVVPSEQVLHLDVRQRLAQLRRHRRARRPRRRRRRLGRAIHRGALLGGDRVWEGLLAEPRNVPNADGLVEGGGENEVVLRVELRAHHVVVVPRQHLRSAAAERGVSAAVAGVSGQRKARRGWVRRVTRGARAPRRTRASASSRCGWSGRRRRRRSTGAPRGTAPCGCSRGGRAARRGSGAACSSTP